VEEQQQTLGENDLKLIMASITENIKASDPELSLIATTALARTMPNTQEMFKNEVLRKIIMECLFTAASLAEET
jgi:hypothetical protein